MKIAIQETKSYPVRVTFTPEKIISTNGGCTRAMVKPYGVKNEIAGMNNTYELTIFDTLVPIENPIGHLHRGAL